MEFVLISAAEKVIAENVIEDLDLQPEEESLARADIFNDLKMQGSVHSSNPFFKGERGVGQSFPVAYLFQKSSEQMNRAKEIVERVLVGNRPTGVL
jgi:hypothetical protein